MKTSEPVLGLERLLDEAERSHLLEGTRTFIFPVRRKAGDTGFYSRLDREIQEQDIVRILSYRSVKEGYTKVSRPAELVIEIDQLLRARPHVAFFRDELVKLSSILPDVKITNFLRSTGQEGLSDLTLLRSCLEVFAYLLRHQGEIAGYLPRQIPHGQSTKLIGKQSLLLRLFSYWREQPAQWSDFYNWFGLIDQPPEFRFFAPNCHLQGNRVQSFHGLFATEWAKDFDFSELAGTLIVENLETFYALSKTVQATLVIWGGGWKAAHLRPHLQRLPKPVYYWGDIDKEGYEIFGLLKAANTDLISILMDFATLEKYRAIHQRKEIFLGPFRSVESLQQEYEYVARRGILIEQEQMHEEWPFHTALK